MHEGLQEAGVPGISVLAIDVADIASTHIFTALAALQVLVPELAIDISSHERPHAVQGRAHAWLCARREGQQNVRKGYKNSFNNGCPRGTSKQCVFQSEI